MNIMKAMKEKNFKLLLEKFFIFFYYSSLNSILKFDSTLNKLCHFYNKINQNYKKTRKKNLL